MATKPRVWPDNPTHPGELLQDELLARNISVRDLGASLGALAHNLERVLALQGPITAELAWELERVVTGVSARFWMGLQADYDLAVARRHRTSA
jgi:addiction module HigA family antidote